MSLLVRPTAPSLWLGVAVAASFIVAETLLVHLLMGVAPGNTFGAVYLLGVLVVSARWGIRAVGDDDPGQHPCLRLRPFR